MAKNATNFRGGNPVYCLTQAKACGYMFIVTVTPGNKKGPLYRRPPDQPYSVFVVVLKRAEPR